MEQINAIELTDPGLPPDEAVLKGVLGDSFYAYGRLLDLYAGNGLTREWRYYRDGKAWLCKVQKSGNTVAWMSAWKGFMKATIYLPARRIDAFMASGVAEDVKHRILAAKRVGTSLPCMFEIRDESVLESFADVMRFKIESLGRRKKP